MKVKVCRVGEIPPNGMVRFEVKGQSVCIVNAGEEYFAISDTCTHAEASLSEGHLDIDECTVECPLHNAVFSLRTGEALEFPAEEPVRSCRMSSESRAACVKPAWVFRSWIGSLSRRRFRG